MRLAMRLLGLSRRLALAGHVLPLAAAAGALTGAGYTWLAGAEVPTLRSLIAALLVLAAFLLGREAITLRLVAAGALLEIGRASCRERVCQYVYISVGAVDLKKNKYKHRSKKSTIKEYTDKIF